MAVKTGLLDLVDVITIIIAGTNYKVTKFGHLPIQLKSYVLHGKDNFNNNCERTVSFVIVSA